MTTKLYTYKIKCTSPVNFYISIHNEDYKRSDLVFLSSHTEVDVSGLDGVETGEYTSTGNTSENVGSSSLHHGHESFVLHDLK